MVEDLLDILRHRTNLKENVVEKQEERRRIQLEQEAQEAQEEEQALMQTWTFAFDLCFFWACFPAILEAYHDGASTLANTGCLFDQAQVPALLIPR